MAHEVAGYGRMIDVSTDTDLAIVRTEAGAQRYGVPIGSEIGSGAKSKQRAQPTARRTTLLTPETQNKIRAYQRKNGLPETGTLDPATVAHTRAHADDAKNARAADKAAKAAAREEAKRLAAERREAAARKREENARIAAAKKVERERKAAERKIEQDKKKAEAEKKKAEAEKKATEREKEREAAKKAAAHAREIAALERSRKSSASGTLSPAQVQRILARKGASVNLANYSGVDVVRLAGEAYADDIMLGKDGSKWRHGYIPLNAIAVAMKAKKWKGSGSNTPDAPNVPGARGSKRPVAGMRRPSTPRNKVAPTPEQKREAAKRAASGTMPHASDIGRPKAKFSADQYDDWGHPKRGTPAYTAKLREDGRKRLDSGSARSAARYRREARVTERETEAAKNLERMRSTPAGRALPADKNVDAHELSSGGAELRTRDGAIVGPTYKSKLAATRAANAHNKRVNAARKEFGAYVESGNQTLALKKSDTTLDAGSGASKSVRAKDGSSLGVIRSNTPKAGQYQARYPDGTTSTHTSESAAHSAILADSANSSSVTEQSLRDAPFGSRHKIGEHTIEIAGIPGNRQYKVYGPLHAATHGSGEPNRAQMAYGHSHGSAKSLLAAIAQGEYSAPKSDSAGLRGSTIATREGVVIAQTRRVDAPLNTGTVIIKSSDAEVARLNERIRAEAARSRINEIQNRTYEQFSLTHLRRMAANGSSSAEAEIVRREAKRPGNPTNSQLIARAEAMHGADRTRWSAADLKSAAAKGDDAARTELRRRAAKRAAKRDN